MNTSENNPPQYKNPLEPIDPINPDSEKSIKGWNWGGFFFTGLWGIFNGCPIALLVFIPILGPLIMPWVLGFKGNEWAWENKEWASVEAFHRRQKKWAIAGLILFSINIAFFVAVRAGVLFQNAKLPQVKIQNPFSHPEKLVFSETLTNLKQDREITKELGDPIRIGKILRLRRVRQGEKGENIFAEFEIIGTSKKAVVYAEAAAEGKVVIINQLILYLQDPVRKIWQIPYRRDLADAS